MVTNSQVRTLLNWIIQWQKRLKNQLLIDVSQSEADFLVSFVTE